jgi:hypothetical protein
MESTVEFYETSSGKSPVQEFLLKLKATDPNDFAAIIAGWRNCAITSITGSRFRKH